jgi:hypothetical protein
MPGFDGTGPRGMGPMTGGGRGYCSHRGVGLGWAPRWGRGRGGYGPGYGYGYADQGFAPGFATREEEMDYLKSEAEALKRSLEGLEARMRGLAEKDK